jgi:hypothetical protein
VSKCFYTQPVWKKQTALKNGLSAAANRGQVNAPIIHRAVCSRRPPPRPGLATGDFGVDAPSAQIAVLPERRRPSARSLKTARTGLCKWVRLRGRRRFVRRSGLARTGARCERVDICCPIEKKESRASTPQIQSRTFVNDPSAGSPTDTLLRLLRPLPQIICPTSQPNDHGQADHGTHPYRSLTGTIGRSDGRCVQRAGT